MPRHSSSKYNWSPHRLSHSTSMLRRLPSGEHTGAAQIFEETVSAHSEPACIRALFKRTIYINNRAHCSVSCVHPNREGSRFVFFIVCVCVGERLEC
jgi:hypothetical protein